MANKIINWFLGKVQSTSKNEAGQANGRADRLANDDRLAKVVAPVQAAAAVAAPQLRAVGTSGTVVSLSSHGNYPLHDGVARVAAGKIITIGPSTSYASMPGGWASLSNSAGAPSVAPSAAPMATAAASAASAPAPSRTAVASLAPANNENTSGTASWASIPGGWATLAAAGSAAIAAHGNYPLHDGVARVTAGKIIPSASNMSWAAMPGGWRSLHRFA